MVGVALGALLGVLAPPGAGVAVGADESAPTAVEAVDRIGADDLVIHLEALQAIADAHGGNRSVDTPGFDASVDYVVDRLAGVGLTAELDHFAVATPVVVAPPSLEQLAPTPHVYAQGADYVLPHPGAPVPGAGPLQVVADGCEDDQWNAVPAGSVVLVAISSQCPPTDYLPLAWMRVAGVLLAPEEGAAAPPTPVDLGRYPLFYDVPVLSLSGAVAAALEAEALSEVVEVRLDTGYRPGAVDSVNVLAEIPGRSDEVVMVGGHLDSVPEGPGINDNGSGVAGVLALAEHLATSGVVPERTIRFAWWGAEEVPLLGSTAYVESLTADELAGIVAYLNVDMIGSPNWVRYITDPAEAIDSVVSAGSQGITDLLERYFDELGLPTAPAWWSGTSDTHPFSEAGVAVGGLSTGAIVEKTAGQAALFGGVAGEPMDPCYHLPCDTIANTDADIAAEMTRALGSVALELAGSAPAPVPADPVAGAVRATPSYAG